MILELDEFASLAQSRRSIRVYSPEPVAPEIVHRLLTIAMWSPSAHNRQPWRFVAVVDAMRKEQLAQAMGARLRADLAADGVPSDVIERDVQRSYQRITSAPLAICVCLSLVDMDTYADAHRNHNEYLMAVQSTAMAGHNLLLAAHAAGLGACWLCAPLFCPDVVRDILELPADWQPQGLVTIGYAAQVRERTRQPLETKLLWR